MASDQTIRPLPPAVIAQIRSSVTITNLNEVVLELLKNALDASATQIDILLDYGKGACTVEDDGSGIAPSEFIESGRLLKLHCSSKFDSQTDQHGNEGVFLYSLAALSLLVVTSRHHLHRSSNSITVSQSHTISRQLPVASHLAIAGHHGTRVVVRDLFGCMPVRVKQRALEARSSSGHKKDWELLRRGVTGVLLAWNAKIAVSIKDVTSGQKLNFKPPRNQLPSILCPQDACIDHVCSILGQADYIYSQERSSWTYISASTSAVTITGCICLEPAPSKNVQFISAGIHPFETNGAHNILYEEVTRVFLSSDFGIDDSSFKLGGNEKVRRFADGRFKHDGFTRNELKGAAKGIDRWPMFYINVESNKQGSHRSFADNGSAVSSVIDLLRATMMEYLRRNHLRPKQWNYGAVSAQDGALQISTPNRKGKGTTTSRFMPSRGLSVRSMLRMTKGSEYRTAIENVSDVTCRKQAPISTTSSNLPISSRSERRPVTHTQHMLSSEPVRSMSAPPLCLEAPKNTYTSRPSNFASITSGLSASFPGAGGVIRTSIVSKTGKILRIPFPEEYSETDHSTSGCGDQASKGEPNAFLSDSSNNNVSWLDPILKHRSLINTRTGFALHDGGFPKVRSTGDPSSTSRDTSGRNTSLSSNIESPAWLKEIMETWENPVFRPAETSIPHAAIEGHKHACKGVLSGYKHQCSQRDIDQAFQLTGGVLGKISKQALRDAEVISQVDKKFILISVATDARFESSRMLVAVDQHAADERCRIEHLLAELCQEPDPATHPPTPTPTSIQTSKLDKPMHFNIPRAEFSLLRTNVQPFANWGILYELPGTENTPRDAHLTITHLPPLIKERCRLDPKALIALVRSELWRRHENPVRITTTVPTAIESPDFTTTTTTAPPAWVRRIHDCPRGILDLLNSRSCRSAVMFNDELSVGQCAELVKALAACTFPFQCAHGRPSMVPLVDLGSVVGKIVRSRTHVDDGHDGDVENGGEFGELFNAWKGVSKE